MQKRTEIIIETERLLVVTRRSATGSTSANGNGASAVEHVPVAHAAKALNQYQRPERVSLWCSGCGRPVLMMTPREAARTEAAAATISEWAEAGLLHFTVTPTGQLFICSNSLRAANEETANHIDTK
jgi:hypothetical protein